MNENTKQEPEKMAASGSQCSAWLGRDGYKAWRITYQSSEQAARAAYAEVERLRAALRDIAAPVAMLQRRAEAEGAKLNGAQALGYASHAPNLSALARRALDAAP